MCRVGRNAMRAFTLIEVVCAGFILTVAAVGLAASLAQGQRLADGRREELLARAAMQEIFAELHAAPFPDVARLYQDKGFAVPGLTAQVNDPDHLPGEIVFQYGPGGDTTCYTVTVRVKWQVGKIDRQLETVRILSNVRGDAGVPSPLVTSIYPGCTDLVNTVDVLTLGGTAQ